MSEAQIQRYQQGRQLEAAGQWPAAEQIYQDLFIDAPELPNLKFRLALLKHRQGQSIEALKLYRLELQQQPRFWSCRFNLAELLLSLGEQDTATTQFQQALSDCDSPPACAEILSRLAHLALQHGQEVQASQYLKSALLADPQAHLHYALAQVYQQLNQMPEARQHADQALHGWQAEQTNTNKSSKAANVQRKYLAYAAHLQVASQGYQQGRAYYQRYFQLCHTNNQQAHCLAQIANCWQEDNQPERALEVFDQALTLDPQPAIALARAFVLPIVYPSQAELSRWRQDLQSRIQDLAKTGFELADPQTLTSLPTYLAYQGHNDRQILSCLGQAIQQALPVLTSGSLKRKHSQRSRKRLGCLSRYFYRHSVLSPFRWLLATLAQHFDLVLISLDPLISDSLSHDLRHEATAWIPLQGDFRQNLQTIQALELDGLLYTDCGLDPIAYLLAQYRLAPVQMLLPGQPLTSGIPNFDYFVSERYSEPLNAQQQYSEQLILMPELYTHQPFPIVPAASQSRAQLGLPAGNLYLCPVQVQKLVPVMDPVFQAILAQDSEAQLVFIDFSQRGLEAQFLQRLQQGLSPEQMTRVHLKARYNSHQFWQVLFQSDVVLESFPFGSWNTLVQALAAQSCVIALASECLRGRYALGIFQQMQMNETIANSPEQYVEIAIRYASDPALRTSYQRRLTQRRHLFFDRTDVLRPFLEFLHETLA